VNWIAAAGVSGDLAPVQWSQHGTWPNAAGLPISGVESVATASRAFQFVPTVTPSSPGVMKPPEPPHEPLSAIVWDTGVEPAIRMVPPDHVRIVAVASTSRPQPPAQVFDETSGEFDDGAAPWQSTGHSTGLADGIDTADGWLLLPRPVLPRLNAHRGG
jgi:hypothetical protein